MAKILHCDWQRLYAHPVYWLETFIDPARFKGTCYRAANWLCLGSTTGRGHNARTKKRTQPVKDLFGLPLTPHFRELLSQPAVPADEEGSSPVGHGRHSAAAFAGATRVSTPHAALGPAALVRNAEPGKSTDKRNRSH